MPEISVSSLSLAFGSNQVLHDVSFTLHDHEFLTLLGPSGCGKTTTLMSVAGFLKPDAGSIYGGETAFFDQSKRTFLAPEGRNLGMVFQSYAIWPHMTVFGNVAFPLKTRHMKGATLRNRVLEILDLVEMADYADRYPHEISGGQQQRVALARALVYSPTVLLLDEPFSNLDAKLRERARSWLTKLQKELDLTCLFVTHDQDEALSLSDRIIVMNEGKILQVGSPETIYREPNHRFVAEFIGHCTILSGDVTRIDAGHAQVRLMNSAATLTVPAEDATVGDRVEIIVRPEQITMLEPTGATAAENRFEATITSTAFLGDHYAYDVSAAGQAISVTSATHFASESVSLHIPVTACRTLRAA